MNVSRGFWFVTTLFNKTPMALKFCLEFIYFFLFYKKETIIIFLRWRGSAYDSVFISLFRSKICQLWIWRTKTKNIEKSISPRVPIPINAVISKSNPQEISEKQNYKKNTAWSTYHLDKLLCKIWHQSGEHKRLGADIHKSALFSKSKIDIKIKKTKFCKN